MIAGWYSTLNRILQVFTVRPVILTRLSLIVLFQTELVVGTHVMVSDLHRNVLTSIEDVNSHHRPVSATFYFHRQPSLITPRFNLGRHIEHYKVPGLTFYTVLHLGNYLPCHQGSVSDVMT